MTAAKIRGELDWTIEEAMVQFPSLSELAERHGYLLLMFGSVLKKGKGRDLDLHLSPFGALAQSEVGFLTEFGGVLKQSTCRPARNRKRFLMQRDGRLYDFNFAGHWAPRGMA